MKKVYKPDVRKVVADDFPALKNTLTSQLKGWGLVLRTRKVGKHLLVSVVPDPGIQPGVLWDEDVEHAVRLALKRTVKVPPDKREARLLKLIIKYLYHPQPKVSPKS